MFTGRTADDKRVDWVDIPSAPHAPDDPLQRQPNRFAIVFVCKFHSSNDVIAEPDVIVSLSQRYAVAGEQDFHDESNHIGNLDKVVGKSYFGFIVGLDTISNHISKNITESLVSLTPRGCSLTWQTVDDTSVSRSAHYRC